MVPAFAVFVIVMRFTCTYVMLMLALTTVLGQSKIDSRLTELVGQTHGNRSMSLEIGIGGMEQPVLLDTASIKQEMNVTFNEDGTIGRISAIARLKDGAACPFNRLNQLGVSIEGVVGSTVVLSVPPESLLNLDEVEELDYVVADNINHLMNDHARSMTRVDYVDGSDEEKLVESHLPRAYTGKGVVIGIVDTGIDYNHAAFRDAEGNTRVKKVVDYVSGSKVVYTDANEIASLTTDNVVQSHGTHTSCTAGGSRVGDTDLQGMAPDADLVLCGLGKSLADSRLIAAIGEVFAYADEVGKPAVINLSLGEDMSFHDGISSSVVTTIKELNNEGTAEGRIVCFSASNNAGRQQSIDMILAEKGSDNYNLRTVIGETGTVTYNEVEMPYYKKLKLFGYDNDGDDFTAELKAVDITTGTLYPLSEKPLYTTASSTTPVTKLAMTHATNTTNNKAYIKLSNSKTYYFHEPNLRLALVVAGTEGHQMRIINGMKDADTEGFYSKNLTGFTDGTDGLSVNIHACDDAVISVGAYTSRTSWSSMNGKTYHYTNTSLRTLGNVASFSSYGTDDNGVARPDVLAPGVGLISAYNICDTLYFDANGDVAKKKEFICANETQNGRNNYYGVMSGTSMSSPVAAGTIALWLQADPTLNTHDIRETIASTSVNDEYTTNTENLPSGDLQQAGKGKLDALAGMQTFALALKDGEEYTLEEDRTYADGVTYTRMFGTKLVNKWTSACLPFSFNIADYTDQFDFAEIYAVSPLFDTDGDGELTSADDLYIVVSKKTSGYSVANKPYMIRPKVSGDVTISAYDNTLYAAEGQSITCSTTETRYTFTGTYSTVVANAENNYWYMSSGSVSHKETGSTNVGPYRWYLAMTDINTYSNGSAQNNQQSINIAVIGENINNTTAVKLIESLHDNFNCGGSYKLNGIKFNETDIQEGIYIKNGKKIIKSDK